MSKIEVDKVDPQSGTNLELGTSGDTVNIPSGVTLDIKSGATLANNGTATGFPEYDDTVLQSSVAVLGFKVAVNGSLTRYNLVDQSIDEFFDTSGIDASASTNDDRVATGSNFYYRGGSSLVVPSGGDSTDTSISGYTTKVFSTTGTGTLTVADAGDVDVLVVAGGGGGGYYYGGGGGGGGLVYKSTITLTGSSTYDCIVGLGGAVKTSDTGGSGGPGGFNGTNSSFGPNGGAILLTGIGGGGGSDEGGGPADGYGSDGGSGGGASYVGNAGYEGSETQTGQAGDSGTYGFGGDGDYGWNNAPTWNEYFPGGGGGAGGVAPRPDTNNAGNGGAGKDYSATFGTAVGDSGWFASGGGGGFGAGTTATVYGVASAGGGANGSNNEDVGAPSGTANTGGGGGGGGNSATSNRKYSGAGGSGIILVRWADSQFVSVADLALQSTDVTAEAQPTYGEFVTLIENAAGTATLNTDIKGYISRDSGVTFTQGTLVNEGSWGTNKQILGFHELDISAQPAGTSMCYKVTTHNQVASSKETYIYATSIGWR
jgi:hypothetical protein